MRWMPLALASALFTSCASSPPKHAALRFAMVAPAPVAEAPAADAVIVVALDGARWQEIFLGADPTLASAADLAAGAPERIMPTLHRWMTEDGVGIGAPGHGEIDASGPNYVSMPGYTEIFTGRPSACQSNECTAIEEPTLADQVAASGKEALVVASWERIGLVAAWDTSRVVLSAGRHVMGAHGELDDASLAAGRASAPWPGSDDYRPDALTSRVALAAFGRGLPTFSFVGLGDTDEYAHHGDYHGYLNALRAADDSLARIEEHLGPRTAVLVTADHGRCANFRDHGGGCSESSRVFLAVRAPWLAARGYVDTTSLRLADLAPTIRCLLHQEPDPAADAGRSIALVCAR